MNWQVSLILAGLASVVICIGACVLASWHQKRFIRVPYSEINRYRITPRFTVGSDAK